MFGHFSILRMRSLTGHIADFSNLCDHLLCWCQPWESKGFPLRIKNSVEHLRLNFFAKKVSNTLHEFHSRNSKSLKSGWSQILLLILDGFWEVDWPLFLPRLSENLRCCCCFFFVFFNEYVEIGVDWFAWVGLLAGNQIWGRFLIIFVLRKFC